MISRFVVMDEGEATVAEPSIRRAASGQDMEQFGGGYRADAADFFEPGQENHGGRGPQYPGDEENRQYLVAHKSRHVGNQIAAQQCAKPGGETVAAVEIAEILCPFPGGGGIVKVIDRAEVKAGPGQAGESLHEAQVDEIFREKPQ